MKRALSILLLTGCNAVYGLDPTQLVVDAAPDAPPQCSADLAYRQELQQVIYQSCRNYTAARDLDRALAYCMREDRTAFFGEGRVDEVLEEVSVEPAAGMFELRITPEGDRAILTRRSQSGVIGFAMYRREAAGWRHAYDLPVVADYDDLVGAPSGRPNARFLHVRPNSVVVDEYIEEAPDTWRLWHTYTPGDFGTTSLYAQFNLTADGLHVIYQAATGTGTITAVFHAWRDNLGAVFGQGVPIMGVPRNAFDAVMTADCGRIYFSGLSSIFYAQQQ